MSETQKATEVLGITWRENLGLLTGEASARFSCSDSSRRCHQTNSPPMALHTHYWVDAHPDHVAACELTEAARFWAKLSKCDLQAKPHHPERVFHFWSVHQKTPPQPSFVIDTTKTYERKQQAIHCYRSQFPTLKSGLSVPERVAAGDAWWGTMIGTVAGEPFACREPIALSGFGDLR